MIKIKQNRFKSKIVWLAVLAQVIIVLQLTGALSISDIAIVNGVVVSLLEILSLFGILNNPTSANKI